jgi:sulfotransferase
MLFFLSGLPRTGSTLLSSILSQNPNIYAGGNSAVCQLMWDMQVSCETNASEQLKANYKTTTQDDLIRAIPAIYYKNINQTYIFDKCRSWTLPSNLEIIKRYVTPNPKILVLTRPIKEIVDSFVKLRKANNLTGDLKSDLTIAGSEPIMRSLDGVSYAQANNNGEFLFIEYKDFISNPQNTIDQIYDFCKIDSFEHYFTNITNPYPEDDKVYGLMGMHDIKPNIKLVEGK